LPRADADTSLAGLELAAEKNLEVAFIEVNASLSTLMLVNPKHFKVWDSCTMAILIATFVYIIPFSSR
jgi:hypothetical protein